MSEGPKQTADQRKFIDKLYLQISSKDLNISNRDKMLELMKSNFSIAKELFNFVLDID